MHISISIWDCQDFDYLQPTCSKSYSMQLNLLLPSGLLILPDPIRGVFSSCSLPRRLERTIFMATPILMTNTIVIVNAEAPPIVSPSN